MERTVRVAFHTLGCKVNQQETAAIEAAFVDRGCAICPFDSVVDVYVINSCVVTAQAERKSRGMVRRIRSRAPNSLIVLAGCFPQVAGEAAQDTGADILVGSNDKAKIVDLVMNSLQGAEKQALLVSPLGDGVKFERISPGIESDRTRAFLKVQDGCEQFCAYCIIPFARGPERSLPMDEVVERAQQLVARGYHEIVLTGIHLGAYGRDLSQRGGLAGLAKKILRHTDLLRLRFGSLEPNDIDACLIALMKESERICRHLHIPLQSGCDRTLRRMGRRYTTGQYSDLIQTLRSELPLIGITTDIIAGFPGETDEDHMQSEAFLREVAPLRSHVFRYSLRTGTPAAEMTGQIPETVKAQRAVRLVEVASECAVVGHKGYIGQTLRVLIEGHAEGVLSGHSSEYVYVSCDGPAELSGSVVSVHILSSDEKGVYGRLVQE